MGLQMLNRFSDGLLTSQLKIRGFSRGRRMKHDWFTPNAVRLQDREPRLYNVPLCVGHLLQVYELLYENWVIEGNSSKVLVH